ncbi:MAG: hypothetical protein HQL27_00380 [Candidatus Omnitrophica bacterium]|nr:hypothetical protein [Candidatus Omnitrophota bacterium]
MIKEIKSIDIGTMNLISASLSQDEKIVLKKLRHAFLKVKIEQSMTSFLKEEGMQYAEIGEELYILAESAYKMANTMGSALSRPMQDGVLNPKEEKAEIILKILVTALLGKASENNSICYYSIPAEAFINEFRVVYHTGILEEIIESLGYKAKSVNEGMAVVYSSLAEFGFTGIGISCGCGMLNFCVSDRANSLDSFSINRAGDWIDENAAKALAIRQGQVNSVKEKGINLKNPQDRTQKAITIYYKELIRYAVQCLRARLEEKSMGSVFKKPIEIVCAGGTALPTGFTQILKSEIEKTKFPVQINNVFLADDPLYAIARGCLIGAIAENAFRRKKKTNAKKNDQ